MAPVPITYLFDFEFCGEKMRPYVMAEFAANGAEHLVLSDTLIREVMKAPSLAARLQREIAAAGMSWVDAHAPFGVFEDLNVPDPALRPVMLERLRLALRIAADFGVDSITVHTGNTAAEWLGYSLEQLHQALIASLQELLPPAEELGVTVAIENVWFASNTPEKLLDALARCRSPRLGFCYDAGHANLMDKGRNFTECAPVDAWRDYGPVPWEDRALEKLLSDVTTCHLHDNRGQYDEHLIPGRGSVDWSHIAGLLKTAPRLQCIQCETIPVATGSSIAEICRAMRRMF